MDDDLASRSGVRERSISAVKQNGPTSRTSRCYLGTGLCPERDLEGFSRIVYPEKAEAVNDGRKQTTQLIKVVFRRRYINRYMCNDGKKKAAAANWSVLDCKRVSSRNVGNRIEAETSTVH